MLLSMTDSISSGTCDVFYVIRTVLHAKGGQVFQVMLSSLLVCSSLSSRKSEPLRRRDATVRMVLFSYAVAWITGSQRLDTIVVRVPQ